VHQSREKLLAFQQWSFTKIVAIAVKKIEGKVNDRDLRDEMLAGARTCMRSCKRSRVAKTLGIQSHDLSVRIASRAAKGIGKGSKFGVALRNVYAIARPQR
jgi:hypothetical protein